MKKLLILAYDFPPYVSVGGLRPYSWFKYLHHFDVHPTVVTRQWENPYGTSLDYIAPGYVGSAAVYTLNSGVIVQAPFDPTPANDLMLKYGENRFKIFRKSITACYELLQFLLPIGSKQKIYRAADEFLKQYEVDCIIATGDPFILFKYASQLSEKYSVPWIADYRDPWIQNKTRAFWILKHWYAFYEKRFLKNASKITTVSTFFQKQIKKNIKHKEFQILHNGFDPEILNATVGIEQSNTALSIAFAGTLYDWHPIESFLRNCNELLEETEDLKLRVHFYGINIEDEISRILSEKFRRMQEVTSFHAKMDNIELAKSMAKQNVFLLFNDYSILGSKIFDYLAGKRRIILCYENDDESRELKRLFPLDEIESESSRLQAEIIEATNSGLVIKDASHLKETIRILSIELLQRGSIICESKNIEQFSRLRQVERLAKIINESVNDQGN